MGTLGGGNGGNWPPDGSDLPEIPAEWGPVVIPDDPAALAAESAQVRIELRDQLRRRRWQRRLRWLAGPNRAGQRFARLPLVLLCVAVLATLTSFLTFGYAGAPRGSGAARTEPAGTDPAGTRSPPRTVPALDLLDAQGQAVSLRALLPSAILLTDGCACTDLIGATVAATPPGVSVLVVDKQVPPGPASGRVHVRGLADPTGELTALLGGRPGLGRAGALLVARDATVARALTATVSIADYREDLRLLPAR